VVRLGVWQAEHPTFWKTCWPWLASAATVEPVEPVELVEDVDGVPEAAGRTLVGLALATCVVDVDDVDVVDVGVDEVAGVVVAEAVADGVVVAEAVGVPDDAGAGGAVMRINAAKLTMSEE
jgi:hypothetical protein